MAGVAGARKGLLPASSSFTPNKGPKTQADGASKQAGAKEEVVVRGLPPRGVLIASGDNFGVKESSTKVFEVAIRHGVAFEAAPLFPLGRQTRRCPQPQFFISFKLTCRRTIPSSFRKF